MKLKKALFSFSALFTAVITTTNIYAADPCFSYWFENDSNGNTSYYLNYGNEANFDNSKSIPISTSEKQNILYVNGNVVSDAKVIIKNNYSLIPLRSISEKLGYTVKWDNLTREITISNNENTVIFEINSLTANNNGLLISLDVAPEIISGITYVPIRAVSNCLGAQLDYYTVNSTYFPLSIISVEGQTPEAKYSVDAAKDIINNQVKDLLLATEESGRKNGWSINYTGDSVQGSYLIDIYNIANLGRYYVFNIYTPIEYDEYNYDSNNLVLFDKSTGDIYSLTPGSSYVGYNVTKGIDSAVKDRILAG